MTRKISIKNKKKFVAVVIALIIIMLSCMISVSYNLINSDKIYNGLIVHDINAGGLTKDKLLSKLNERFNNYKNKSITISSETFNHTIKFNDIDLIYNISKASQEAYDYGRKKNFLSNMVTFFSLKNSNKIINVEYSYNKEKLRNIVNEFALKHSVPSKDYVLSITSDSAKITTGKKGKTINTDKIILSFEDRIKNFNADMVPAKILSINPKPIVIDDIYSMLNSSPKDASYKVTNKKIEILSDEPGKKIEKEVLSNILNDIKDKEEHTVNIPIQLEPAKIKTSDIEASLFKDVLGTYNTQFYTGDTNNDNRKINITIATSKINGTILAPGQSFSFNNVVGPRTPEFGYKDAHAYIGGEIVDSTGGGICQVSSTLYNSVLLADLGVLERHNHMFTVGYVPKGRDAAVAYSSSDFSFKNITNSPLKISCWVSGDNKVYFTLLGNKENKSKTVDYRSVVVKEIPPEIKNIDDPELPEGETKTENEGFNGFVVDLYKITNHNGVYSENKISTSTYRAYPKQIKVGKKKLENIEQKILKETTNELDEITPHRTGVDDADNPPANMQ